jgi:hypothetical protein
MRVAGERRGVEFWASAGAACLLAAAGAARADDKPAEKPPRLEFRVLADKGDDADAFAAAAKLLTDPKQKDDLRKRAEEGKPPPAPETPADKGPGYAWVEVGPAELHSLQLDDADGPLAKRAAAAREAGDPVATPDDGLLFSRECRDANLTKEEREKKKFDYFFLTRLPAKGNALTGAFVEEANKSKTVDGGLAVSIQLNMDGGRLMRELTAKNNGRFLAVVVDGKVVSAPTIRTEVGARVQITWGAAAEKEVDALVEALRSDLPKKDK